MPRRRLLSVADVEALAEQTAALLQRIAGGELTASTAMRYRLEGALVALEAVLGRPSQHNGNASR